MAGLIGVMLALAAWQLPQLPGQLSDEHAAAANWLLNTSTTYGIWGNPFLALGLFDVLRSPLLYLLLTLLVPTLAAQLADQLGALRQLRGLQALDLSTPAQTPGDALPLSSARPLFRWRGIVEADHTVVAESLATHIQNGFPITQRDEAVLSTKSAEATGEEMASSTPRHEARLQGLRHPRLHYLRPFLMVGLLVSVIGAWTALAFGWQVTAPPLAPGAIFRSANRDLVLHYTMPTTDTLQPSLEATLQGLEVALPNDQTTQRNLGSAQLQVRPAYPAIWITTADGGERLTLPGDPIPRSHIGLVFANPGSEESILIPDQGAGLRIVQRAGSNGFVLELYRSDSVQPIYRADLTLGGQLTVPFSPTDTGLLISTLPGLQVDVRHLPGLMLVPIGFLIALVGAFAFLRPSAFIMAQVAPWSTEHTTIHTTVHTIVVLQSDHPAIIEELRALVSAISPTEAVPTENSDESPQVSS